MTKEIVAKLRVDKTQAEADVQEFKAKFDVASLAAGASLAALGAVVTALTGFIREGTAAAHEYALAHERLSNVLKLHGDASGVVSKRLNELNNELSRKLGFNETELLQLERELALRGVHSESLAQATRMTIGLAQATGQNLASAGATVAKVLEGHYESLRKIGINATGAVDAVNKLSDLFKSAGDGVDTYAGQVKLLNEEWERFKREVFEQKDEKQSWSYKFVVGLRDELKTLEASFARLRAYGDGSILKGLFSVQAGNDLLTNVKARLRGSEGLAEPGGSPAVAEFETQQSVAKAKKEEDEKRKAAADAAAAAEAKWEKQNEENLKRAMEHLKEYEENERKETEAAIKQEHAKSEAQAAEIESREFARREALDHMRDMDDKAFENSIALLSTQEQERLRIIRAGLKQELQERKNYNQMVADAEQQIGQMLVSGMAETMGGIVKAAVEGKESLGSVIGALVGGVIVKIGEMLVQLGTAALIGGLLGTAAPIFGLITGGPAAIAAGGIAIGVGLGMIGVGTAMGGGGGGSGARTGTAGVGSPGATDRSYGGPGTATPEAQAKSQTIIVHFDRGVIASEPAPFARQLGDYLKQGGRQLGWAR